MIVATAMMTAFCGAVSISNPDNIATMYVIVTFASLGVGGVIIPGSIIAQIVCPTELIATITAITLSIRYIGGAIGYTAYYNVFYHVSPLTPTVLSSIHIPLTPSRTSRTTQPT